MPKDPVCGMEVEEGKAHSVRTVAGRRVPFCSASYEAKFDASPGTYLAEPGLTETGEPLDMEALERERLYRLCLRKFWFSALVSLPVIVLSYPWYFPVLRDHLPPAFTSLRVAGAPQAELPELWRVLVERYGL